MMMTRQWRARLLRRSALELESLYPSHLLLAQLQSQAFLLPIFLENKALSLHPSRCGDTRLAPHAGVER